MFLSLAILATVLAYASTRYETMREYDDTQVQTSTEPSNINTESEGVNIAGLSVAFSLYNWQEQTVLDVKDYLQIEAFNIVYNRSE